MLIDDSKSWKEFSRLIEIIQNSRHKPMDAPNDDVKEAIDVMYKRGWLEAGVLEERNMSHLNLSGISFVTANCYQANFSNSDLRQTDWSGANLFGSDLRKTMLDYSYLGEVNLRSASLREASLKGARLHFADMTSADLTNADLRGVDLTEANLTNAILDGARLYGARMHNTNFVNIDLSNTYGLTESAHSGPSYIDFTTLYKSWPLPAEFLTGCGVPYTLIDALDELVAKEGRMIRTFISYSHADMAFAEELEAELRKAKIYVWRDVKKLRNGEEINDTIEQAISEYDHVIVICSEDSLQSEPVGFEVITALQKEIDAETTNVVIPVRVDNAIFENNSNFDWVPKLRKRWIGDFTNWSDDKKFEASLTQLIRSLKTIKKTID